MAGPLAFGGRSRFSVFPPPPAGSGNPGLGSNGQNEAGSLSS